MSEKNHKSNGNSSFQNIAIVVLALPASIFAGIQIYDYFDNDDVEDDLLLSPKICSVDVRRLGWQSGNKNNFCMALGYTGYDVSYETVTDLDAGRCFKKCDIEEYNDHVIRFGK